jgi:RNA-splicing ligase RtcB
MIEVVGKYNVAKVYTDNIEPEAYRQILNMMNQQFSERANIAVMPDVHAGTGCVIGLTMDIKDKVVPNLVGVDIGCGMLVQKVSREFPIDPISLDTVIHDRIPSGCKHRTIRNPLFRDEIVDSIVAPVNKELAALSLGTLGGGNHFIELDTDKSGDQYIVIHSGSRHLGVEVCKWHQSVAVDYHHKGLSKAKVIERLKREGNERLIEETLAKMERVPDDLAYLEGRDMELYLHDMELAQLYATRNREAMLFDILNGLRIPHDALGTRFCTVHNYIELPRRILRKGAISLECGELAIIPMNMCDGSLIVRGYGNPDWNCSGPHGAGRIMSRSKAKESIGLEEFKRQMVGIYTTSVNRSTIDEAPQAYKPMKEIVANISDTAKIVDVIKPVYNFKASED